MTARPKGCAGTGISNRPGGGTVVGATLAGGRTVTGNAADVAGPTLGGGRRMAGMSWVDRASSAPYLVVSLSTSSDVIPSMSSRV